jgi:hypothetical protein
MGSQPNHQDVYSALNKLCAQTDFDVEAQLAQQKELDEAEARRLVEEERTHLSVDLLHCEPPTRLDKTPLRSGQPMPAGAQNPTE